MLTAVQQCRRSTKLTRNESTQKGVDVGFMYGLNAQVPTIF